MPGEVKECQREMSLMTSDHVRIEIRMAVPGPDLNNSDLK